MIKTRQHLLIPRLIAAVVLTAIALTERRNAFAAERCP
jgi:hypothetical protein